MPDPFYDDRTTRQAKQGLLDAGLLASTLEPDVPDVIQRSWRRCLSISAPIVRVDVAYRDTVDRHGQLLDAARPVFERIGGHLAGMGVALFLSDKSGQIVLRHISDRRQRDIYDGASAAEGFDFAETSIGTNGLGTVLEEREPVFVRGSEHFNEALESLACAGVPIFKPYTRQVVGSFALACRADVANALMYGMALDVGRQIETNIASMQGDRERALARAYLTADQSRRDPVMVVSEHSALANTTGLQYLSHESHALLWDYLLTRPGSDVPTQVNVPLEGGRHEAIVQRVTGADEDATYLLRILPSPAPPPDPTRHAVRHRQRRLPPRSTAPAAGSLHPVLAIDDEIAAAARSAACLAIDGAPGTGKRTAAQNLLFGMHRAENSVVIDFGAATQGSRGWYQEAANELAAGRGVILAHVQDLPTRQVNLVKALVQQAAAARQENVWDGSPAKCSFVMTVDLSTSPAHVEMLVRQVAAIVTLPTLSAMRDQIPGIAAHMLSELPSGHHPTRLSTSALQALMRWRWPGNLTELRTTLEQVAERTPGPTVDPNHLPLHIQVAPQRRSLSGMESVERDAIISALHHAGGNRSAAATALGIGRTTLYRKLRTYQIET